MRASGRLLPRAVRDRLEASVCESRQLVPEAVGGVGANVGGGISRYKRPDVRETGPGDGRHGTASVSNDTASRA